MKKFKPPTIEEVRTKEIKDKIRKLDKNIYKLQVERDDLESKLIEFAAGEIRLKLQQNEKSPDN